MRFDIAQTLLVVVDIQVKLVAAIADLSLDKVKLAVAGATALELPVVVTEQYPQGLGVTLKEILELLPASVPIIEKNTFSCCGSQEFKHLLEDSKVKTVVLCGVESHVCVAQTALDLRAEGYQVVLLADAVASRKRGDYDLALELMRHNGVWVTSTEAFLFEMLGSSAHPSFKTISKLVR